MPACPVQDMPSRLPTTASTMLANNLSKFLLSIGPQVHTCHITHPECSEYHTTQQGMFRAEG